MTQDADLPTKAAPKDSKETSDPAPPNGQPAARGGKVELDIADAPFLEEPEEEKPKETPAEPAKTAPGDQPKAKDPPPPKGLRALLANKKKLALLAGGLLLVLVAVPLILMFVLKREAPPPPPPAPERIVVSGVPQREDAPPGPAFLYRLGGFFIERRGSEGELRFLRCSFAIPTNSPALFAELSAKDVVVRDAIYYYLTNRPLTFLADRDLRESLKSDLLSVINEQISSERVEELLFEEYLVTGG